MNDRSQAHLVGRVRPLQPGADFVGRRPELATLHAALDATRAGSPRVVIVGGPPGIGKTTLVERFLALEEPARVIRAQGDTAESLVPYGVIDQLLRVAGVDAVDLLERDEPLPDAGPVNLGLRVLATLSAVQRDGVVALVVEDAQWVDGPSLQALTFALRRLVADSVLAIVTARTAQLERLPDGLRRLALGTNGVRIELDPLDANELRELAGHHGISLEGTVAARLADHTSGNPLHARALLTELPPEAWRSPPRLLPAPRPYADIIRRRVADASPRARELVEAASVLGERSALFVAAALAREEEPLSPLRELAEADLLAPVASGEGRTDVAFGHPLTRAAIYHTLPPDRRAQLHMAAADQADDDEQVELHHRVLAAHGPDGALADRLELAGEEQAARGAWFGAANKLAAASRLSPAREQSEVRLLKATDMMALAGDVAAADALIDELADTVTGPMRDCVLAQLLLFRGRPEEPGPLLDRAWRACDAQRDPMLATRIGRTSLHFALARVRGSEIVLWARRVLELAGADDPARAFALGATAIGRGYLGEAALAERELERALSGLDGSGLPHLTGLGWVKLAQDRFDAAMWDFARAAESAWNAGSYDIAAMSYAHLARAEHAIGSWDDARLHADRSLAIVASLEHLSSRPFSWWAAALVPAARGDHAATDALLASLEAQPILYEDQIAGAAMARAHIATWRGQPEAVLAALAPLAGFQPREGIDEPGFWPWHAPYGDALLAMGRLEEAELFVRRHLSVAEDRGLRSATAPLRRVRGRLEAVQGSWPRAVREFEESIADGRQAGMPFETARSQLAFGEALRRQGQRRTAGAQLESARDTFESLGARPAAVRAERELVACGLSRGKPAANGEDGLTPQEDAVRRLVCRGMTNRQIAAELLVSPKTVEVHLTRVYRKLGVSSRNQLMAISEKTPRPGAPDL